MPDTKNVAQDPPKTWTWIPLKQIGSINFGDCVWKHIKALKLQKTRECIDADGMWRYYESPEYGVRLNTLNGAITSVACDDEFLHNGANLIGTDFYTVCNIFGVTALLKEVNPLGYTVDIPESGLTLNFINDCVSIATVWIDRDVDGGEEPELQTLK